MVTILFAALVGWARPFSFFVFQTKVMEWAVCGGNCTCLVQPSATIFCFSSPPRQRSHRDYPPLYETLRNSKSPRPSPEICVERFEKLFPIFSTHGQGDGFFLEEAAASSGAAKNKKGKNKKRESVASDTAAASTAAAAMAGGTDDVRWKKRKCSWEPCLLVAVSCAAAVICLAM